MPNYPSSFISGSAPGLRSVNNITDRRDFKYFLEPSAGSQAGFAFSVATFQPLATYSAVGSSLTYALTGGGVALTVDTISAALVSNTSTILVKNETGANAKYNGLYLITNKGATGTSWVLYRDTRFDEDPELKYNSIYSVAAGTTNANTEWYLNISEPMTVGGTALSFTQVPTTIDYNSAANYPTDVNVGIEELNLSSDFINDFKSMLNTSAKDLADLETELNNLDTTVGTKYLAASNIYTIQHIYRRLEKLNFQILKLKNDIALMNDATYFSALFYTSVSGTNSAIGLTGRYPSSKNRLTNVSNGI